MYTDVYSTIKHNDYITLSYSPSLARAPINSASSSSTWSSTSSLTIALSPNLTSDLRADPVPEITRLDHLTHCKEMQLTESTSFYNI